MSVPVPQPPPGSVRTTITGDSWGITVQAHTAQGGVNNTTRIHQGPAAPVALDAVPGPPDGFTGRAQALAWLKAEHDNPSAAVRTAHRIGHTPTATYLPSCLARHLGLRRRFEDAIAVHTLVRDTAHQQEDSFGEAVAWNNLGKALREARGKQQAREAFELAVQGFRALGDDHNVAVARDDLARLRQRPLRWRRIRLEESGVHLIRMRFCLPQSSRPEPRYSWGCRFTGRRWGKEESSPSPSGNESFGSPIEHFEEMRTAAVYHRKERDPSATAMWRTRVRNETSDPRNTMRQMEQAVNKDSRREE